MKNKRGVAFPMLIIAAIVVAGFIAVMSNLGNGIKDQVYRTNNEQISFLIAYSAFSRVLAKIHSFSWSKRPFATEPYIETKVASHNAFYDLLVEDTSGKTLQADIYIRTHLLGISRLYFWRAKFNNDLLEISNRVKVEIFKMGDASDFPKKTGPRPFAKMVNDMIAKRKANQGKSDEMSIKVARANDVDEVINIMDGRKRAKFNSNYPDNPSGSKIDKISPTSISIAKRNLTAPPSDISAISCR